MNLKSHKSSNNNVVNPKYFKDGKSNLCFILIDNKLTNIPCDSLKNIKIE